MTLLMIPIELFFLVNLIMDFYLLYLSLRWLDARRIRSLRLLFASAIGSVYACAAYAFASWLLIPPLPFLAAIPMVWISIGHAERMPFKILLKGAGFMLAAAFLSAGTIYAIQRAIPGTPYIPLMMVSAVVTGIASLALGRNKRRAAWIKGEIQYRYKDVAGRFDAAVDSGNHAIDPVSGLPVIVAPAEIISKHFSPPPASQAPPLSGEASNVKLISELGTLPVGFRLMALSTISGTRLAPVFTPDMITWNGKPIRAAIALAPSGRLPIALAPSCLSSGEVALPSGRLAG